MRLGFSALVLSAGLILGGCQTPDGSVDWGNTLLLGLGAGAAAALVAGAASNAGPKRYHGAPRGYGPRYGPSYRYVRPTYRHGYGYGYRPAPAYGYAPYARGW